MLCLVVGFGFRSGSRRGTLRRWWFLRGITSFLALEEKNRRSFLNVWIDTLERRNICFTLYIFVYVVLTRSPQSRKPAAPMNTSSIWQKTRMFWHLCGSCGNGKWYTSSGSVKHWKSPEIIWIRNTGSSNKQMRKTGSPVILNRLPVFLMRFCFHENHRKKCGLSAKKSYNKK